MAPLADPINNIRSHLHAFGTDIESFFRNILVDEKDKAIFRFFWFKNPEMTKLELYQFLAHIFGATSSPTVTGWVLSQHAENLKVSAQGYASN